MLPISWTYEEFISIYLNATKEKYHFLLIDMFNDVKFQ